MKIPATFKSFIDESYGQDFFITSLDGQSVRLYPFPVWREIEEKLAALPSFNQAKKRFLDHTNYWGQLATADSQARVLIPAHLREAAAMQGNVSVLGFLNYLEVWNTEKYRDHLNKEKLTTEDLETLSGLGI